MAVVTVAPAADERSRRCDFGPLVVEFDDRVLVPRPWTLVQSEWAAQLAADAAPGAVLELCAGAGHIGLAAAVLADRDLVQVEADPIAAAYAVANAARAGRSERVDVRNARLESALLPNELFPIVLADPPYLPTADLVRWPEDPPMAIDGGPDGMAVIIECLYTAARHLLPDGRLLLQTAGPAQNRAVLELLGSSTELGLTGRDVRVVDDQRAVLLLAPA